MILQLSHNTVPPLLLFITCFLVGCRVAPTARPLYGDDTRVEMTMADSVMCRVGSSTLAVVHASSLVRSAETGDWQFRKNERLDQKGWCASERFVEQTAQANCTAFLITPDRVATAGHCINAPDDSHGPGLNCPEAVFVFNYRLGIDGLTHSKFRPDEVYRCRSVMGGFDSAIGPDWRVVSLERSTNRLPLSLHRGGPLPPGTPIEVVGHPLGLPMKLARGVTSSVLPWGGFLAAVDTFKGSSGSPIIVRSGQRAMVAGLLSGGVRDDKPSSGTSACRSVLSCVEGEACPGEQVTGSQVLLAYAAPSVASPQATSTGLFAAPCDWCSDSLRSRHWQCGRDGNGFN